MVLKHYLEYRNVKYHVLDRYINTCVSPNFSSFQKEIGPVNTLSNRIINIDSKGASKLYKNFNSNKVKIFLDITEKWENKTGIRFTNHEIENSFILNHKSNVNMYMRYTFSLEYYTIELQLSQICTK